MTNSTVKKRLSYIQLSYELSRSLYRDIMYLRMANIWAQNSFAKRAKVGALIVKDGRIISDGYNGMPSTMPNACEYMNENGVLTTNKEVLHAESNALMKLCSFGAVSSKGSVLFCTFSPCMHCAKLIIQAGVKHVHFTQLYRDLDGLNLLMDCGIHCFYHAELPITLSNLDLFANLDVLTSNSLMHIVYYGELDDVIAIMPKHVTTITDPTIYASENTMYLIQVSDNDIDNDNKLQQVLYCLDANAYDCQIAKIGVVGSSIMSKVDIEKVCNRFGGTRLYIESDL